jgi:predicted transcriptional regulator
MAKKRERLEVIWDILKVIQDSNNSIKPTRLLYASNLSPQMFKEYVEELKTKDFV